MQMSMPSTITKFSENSIRPLRSPFLDSAAEDRIRRLSSRRKSSTTNKEDVVAFDVGGINLLKEFNDKASSIKFSTKNDHNATSKSENVGSNEESISRKSKPADHHPSKGCGTTSNVEIKVTDDSTESGKLPDPIVIDIYDKEEKILSNSDSNEIVFPHIITDRRDQSESRTSNGSISIPITLIDSELSNKYMNEYNDKNESVIVISPVTGRISVTVDTELSDECSSEILQDFKEVDEEEIKLENEEKPKVALDKMIKSEHATGLSNLGNTCYMNSIIQCLAHTVPVLEAMFETMEESNFDHFMNHETKSTSLKRYDKESDKKSNDLVNAFIDLTKKMWNVSTDSDNFSTRYSSHNDHFISNTGSTTSRNKIENLRNFKREVGRYAKQFQGFDQHDSQEFLQYLLEGIHEELNIVVKSTKNEDNKEKIEGGDSTAKDISTDDGDGEKAWKKYLAREKSILTDIFVGQLRSTLQCQVCGYDSIIFEPFWFISLPIDRSSSTSNIYDCFSLFTKKETLDGENRPKCERCKIPTVCQKWYLIERWPRILIVHLKRFSSSSASAYGGGWSSYSSGSKISNHVDVSTNSNLDFSPFSNVENSQRPNTSNHGNSSRYSLYAVSNHSGTLHSGHYTAVCKHPVNSLDSGDSYSSSRDNPKWHLYNDSMVGQVNSKFVVTHEAYVLFFQQV